VGQLWSELQYNAKDTMSLPGNQHKVSPFYI
jgi:hypothetical protein